MEQFWKIIPQITTPLAALCFIAGIIYILIRVVVSSNNQVKEKSLEVKDPEAQRIAAENILKDHPDLKISPITDELGKVELAKLIIRSKQNKYQGAIYGFIILAIIFAGAYLIPILNSGTSDVAKEEEEFLKKGSWAELKAIKAKSKYALLSVVQHIKFRDVKINGEMKRLAEFRNTYTIVSTDDIKTTDQAFAEEFTTSSAKVEPWPGTDDQQIESNTDAKFWVKFDLKKYQTKTIMTGANYIYSFPLRGNNHTTCFGAIEDNPSEWMTCYPNETDFIDNLTMIVESEGVGIERAPNSMYRKKIDGSIENTDGKCRVYSTNRNCTLVAQWDTLKPGECVAFKLAWKR